MHPPGRVRVQPADARPPPAEDHAGPQDQERDRPDRRALISRFGQRADDHELAALIRRGEYLDAYDLAKRRLEKGETTTALAHAAVLCLARSGATDFARLEYARLRLGEADDQDAATLGARLLKDGALSASGARRRALARASADRYEAVLIRHGGLYSAVNVATLSLIAGDAAKARDFARRALDLATDPAVGEAAYYDDASRAEALVLLGRFEAAAEMMARATLHAPASFTAHASTLRQFEVILNETGGPIAWLDSFRPPTTAHFTGNIFSTPETDGPDAGRVAELRVRMAKAIADARVGFGYGGLAAGADILWAEALLAAGAELHVVLPTSRDSFLETSVLPFGEAWGARFEACLARARSVRLAAKDPYGGDDHVFAYSSQFAIGCAVLRAQALATEAVQLAVSDGMRDLSFGVPADLAYWARTARPQTILPFDRPVMRDAAIHPAPGDRAMKAMLFVDVRGFGALRDDQVPAFFDVVMAEIARVVTAMPAPPEHVETWGDGVFLVFGQPVDAAEAALAMLAAHRQINLPAHGLPRGLALRIGGHYGPVHLRVNPILGSLAVVGAHVVMAARIEPNAAPGSAYVSEALAGALATFHADRFRCGYVGRTRPRKDFPPLSIFNLSPRT